jgi:hypothetical protein
MGTSAINGVLPRHTDEVLDLVEKSDTTFEYSMTQVLWVPRFVRFNPTPQWGYLLDNSGETQSSFSVLVWEIDGRVPDVSKDQAEKIERLGYLTLSLLEERESAIRNIPKRMDLSFEHGAGEDPLPCSHLSTSPYSERSSGRPWTFDHWSCNSR